jgi:hypothetical protein
MTPDWREYSRFCGLAARLTRGVDGYQLLGKPKRWSRGAYVLEEDQAEAVF